MIPELVIGIAAIVALLVQARQYALDRQRVEKAWTQERRELLERIQRPERPPVEPATPFDIPEQPQDEWNLVNTISYEPQPEGE